MKRYMRVFLFVMLAVIVPAQAYAYSGTYYYSSFNDTYRVDYTYPSGVSHYELYFQSPTGEIFTGEYDFSPTGIHYLTCNGTYNLNFYNSSDVKILTLGPYITTSIINPTCSSYADGISGKDDLNASSNGTNITWSPRSGASNYEIWKDGYMINSTTGTSYTPASSGSYSIVARSSGGEVLGNSDINFEKSSGGGTTDPGPGGGTDPDDPDYGDFDPNCTTCQNLWELLQCPDWDDYMDAWSDMIRNSVPPAPDWHNVAAIMRDTIVPAIGQELLDKMPQYAKIIGDDLQSREKPVQAPPALPSFNPEVPKITDLPNKETPSLTEDVPNFEPDYSESKPFIIPDPMTAIDMSTDDKGYVHNPNLDTTNPEYKKTEAAEPDKGYKPMPEPDLQPPAYQNKNTTSSAPIPSYKNTSPAASEPTKDYHVTDDAPMPSYHNTNPTSSTPMPEYTAR